jgi:hypothetical protein
VRASSHQPTEHTKHCLVTERDSSFANISALTVGTVVGRYRMAPPRSGVLQTQQPFSDAHDDATKPSARYRLGEAGLVTLTIPMATQQA